MTDKKAPRIATSIEDFRVGQTVRRGMENRGATMTTTGLVTEVDPKNDMVKVGRLALFWDLGLGETWTILEDEEPPAWSANPRTFWREPDTDAVYVRTDRADDDADSGWPYHFAPLAGAGTVSLDFFDPMDADIIDSLVPDGGDES